nr:MAG TPA: hypothetical protein [Caudoviricetes sp.]
MFYEMIVFIPFSIKYYKKLLKFLKIQEVTK